jgi:predicted methyltransferase
LKGERRAGYFGITRRESSLDKWREIQRTLINEFNVVITDIIRNFNHYINWGYEEETRAWKLAPIKKKPEEIWYKSYMFRIETLKDSRGFEEEVDVGDELYNDAESSTT